MIAARKGSKLSERDQDGVVDDLAQLEALENEERKEKNEIDNACGADTIGSRHRRNPKNRPRRQSLDAGRRRQLSTN